jgi:5-methylcytosine-specific restriction endonuclease McrA
MPIGYADYPADWPAIRQRILERAGNRCERCGLLNGALGYRDMRGRWVPATRPDPPHEAWDHNGQLLRRVRIVLTIAHIHNPDPHDVRDSNLEALCQQCHNRLDAPMRRINAAATRRKRCAEAGQEELPL